MNLSFDKYAYNTRSEVIGAQRYHGTDVSDISRVYGGRGFGYNYDPIGNRTSASETIGGESLVKSYTANELNQYTAIANPDAVGLRGDATNTAVVSVNGEAAARDTVGSTVRPWHFALPADNAEGPDYTLAEIIAVVNPPGTNEADIVSTASGSVYAPPQQEALTYDDDGNLLSDGRWQYTWNGENRLIRAEELLSPPMREPYMVEYAYDHLGRMVRKTIAFANMLPLQKITSYHWDGYNIIAETVAQGTATNTTYNVWGLDIGGSLQGAGGVGGLLAVVKHSATYITTYNANGNIIEYVAADGTIAAHREYDPFGGTVVATGDANAFSHWFSTKPWCAVTSLSEYQYRKYSSTLGRWLNRDPIGERVGVNNYVFIGNASLCKVDLFGLMTAPVDARTWTQELWTNLGSAGAKRNASITFAFRGSCSETGELSINSLKVESVGASSGNLLQRLVGNTEATAVNASISPPSYSPPHSGSITLRADVSVYAGNAEDLWDAYQAALKDAAVGASMGAAGVATAAANGVPIPPGALGLAVYTGAAAGYASGWINNLFFADWHKLHEMSFYVDVDIECKCAISEPVPLWIPIYTYKNYHPKNKKTGNYEWRSPVVFGNPGWD